MTPLISNLYVRAPLAALVDAITASDRLHSARASEFLTRGVYLHGLTLAQVGMTGGMVGEAL